MPLQSENALLASGGATAIGMAKERIQEHQPAAAPSMPLLPTTCPKDQDPIQTDIPHAPSNLPKTTVTRRPQFAASSDAHHHPILAETPVATSSTHPDTAAAAFVLHNQHHNLRQSRHQSTAKSSPCPSSAVPNSAHAPHSRPHHQHRHQDHHPRHRQAVELLHRLPLTTEDLCSFLQFRAQTTEHRLQEAEIELSQQRMEILKAKQELLQWRQAAIGYRRERDVLRANVQQLQERNTRFHHHIQKVQRQMEVLEHHQQGPGLYTQAEQEVADSSTVVHPSATTATVTATVNPHSSTPGTSLWNEVSILKDLQELLDDHVTHSIDRIVLEKDGQLPDESHPSAEQSSLPSAKCLCGCQEEVYAWKARVARAEEKAEKARMAKHLSVLKFEQVKLQWSRWRDRVLAANREQKRRTEKKKQEREKEREDERQQERILRENTDFNRNLSLHDLTAPSQPKGTNAALVAWAVDTYAEHQQPPSFQQHQYSQPQVTKTVAAEKVVVDEASGQPNGVVSDLMEIERAASQAEADDDDDDNITEELHPSPVIHRPRRNFVNGKPGASKEHPPQYSLTFPSDLAMHRRELGDVEDECMALYDDDNDNIAGVFNAPSIPSTGHVSQQYMGCSSSLKNIAEETFFTTVPVVGQKNRVPTFESDMSSPLFDLERGEQLSDVEEIEMISAAVIVSTPAPAPVARRNLETRVMEAFEHRERGQTFQHQQQPIELDLPSDDGHSDDDFQRPQVNVKMQQRQEQQHQFHNNRVPPTRATRRLVVPETPRHAWPHTPQLSSPRLQQQQLQTVHFETRRQDGDTQSVDGLSTRDPLEVGETAAAEFSSARSSGAISLTTTRTTHTSEQPEHSERIYNYTERRKHKRKQMHAEDCACCRGWYEAVGPLPRPDGYHAFFDPIPVEEQTDRSAATALSSEQDLISVAARKQGASRHRVQHRERLTPPGFWMVGFPTTEERAEMDRVARERAQLREGKRSRVL